MHCSIMSIWPLKWIGKSFDLFHVSAMVTSSVTQIYNAKLGGKVFTLNMRISGTHVFTGERGQMIVSSIRMNHFERPTLEITLWIPPPCLLVYLASWSALFPQKPESSRIQPGTRDSRDLVVTLFEIFDIIRKTVKSCAFYNFQNFRWRKTQNLHNFS